jgi:hypothetical protein
MKMKIKYLRLGIMPVAALGLAILTGCVVEPGRVVIGPPAVVVAAPPPPPPAVVVAAPAPVVVVAPAPVVEVPDYYVWDGIEFVGYVGSSCFYLGPGNVWFVCDPIRVARFHDYERFHPDWRVRYAVHNDRFRTDRFGHTAAPHRDAAPERAEHRPVDRRADNRDEHHDDRH